VTVEELVVERPDIEAARDRVARYVRRTPVLETGAGAFGIDASLMLKLEQLQHTGSFKLRGAFNKMLASDVPDVGVIAASGGNFGFAARYERFMVIVNERGLDLDAMSETEVRALFREAR